MDEARVGFNRVCDGLRSAAYVSRLLSQMLVAPPWILVALVVVAVIVGGLLAVAIFGLLGAYVLAWILNLIVARIIAVLANALGHRASEFAATVPEVVANCPENCRGDMSVPTCSY